MAGLKRKRRRRNRCTVNPRYTLSFSPCQIVPPALICVCEGIVNHTNLIASSQVNDLSPRFDKFVILQKPVSIATAAPSTIRDPLPVCLNRPHCSRSSSPYFSPTEALRRLPSSPLRHSSRQLSIPTRCRSSIPWISSCSLCSWLVV